MNRQQRRAANAPAEEPKRVTLEIYNDAVKFQMTGTRSHVSSHTFLTPHQAFKLGWGLIKGAWRTWKPFPWSK